jgi:hypothetical protein
MFQYLLSLLSALLYVRRTPPSFAFAILRANIEINLLQMNFGHVRLGIHHPTLSAHARSKPQLASCMKGTSRARTLCVGNELVYRKGLHVYAAAGGTRARMGMHVSTADVTYSGILKEGQLANR